MKNLGVLRLRVYEGLGASDGPKLCKDCVHLQVLVRASRGHYLHKSFHKQRSGSSLQCSVECETIAAA